MKMISTDYFGKVAVIKLNRSVTNALNPELLNELAEALQQAKNNSNVHGLVLSSSDEKFFSIGFDIPQLFELTEKNFELFYRTFNHVCLDLYTLPKPTVAALTGHAIAGGCILALCCDYRIAGKGRKLMGLNEVKLGVPVPYLADCVLRQLVGVRYAREIMEAGEFYQVEDLLRTGMVDQVLPLEQVLQESIQKAKLLGGLPEKALAMIKHNRVETVEKEVLARLEEKERFFIECWYSDLVRERLREAMEKFKHP
ncbi:MAG: enoyl-CoA hydratase/isomerase family protein [Planctomycetes bacterium]|nr:enoyl-CoA hydratase/isomerase family protein [Planctomycetota bacterium]